MSDPLEDSLNIDPVEPEKQEKQLRKKVEIDTSNYPDRQKMDQRKDYTEVRDNLKEVIDNSKIAIDGILKVASESDSPRAFEVVSQLLKTSTEANKELLDVHKQMKDLEKDESVKKVTNNAFFVGSTKELQDMIQKQLPKGNVKKIR
jgi:predicted RNase H-like HicB family nuclease|tara:strand:- start:510 stop:950 length:441 start_codon:yes stop_codon:yes gene_type:complete